MKVKTNILIIASSLALITLICIQYFLIKNTFELKRDLFLKEVKEITNKINNSDEKDEYWDAAYATAIKKSAIKLKHGAISKEKFLHSFTKTCDSINNLFNTFFKKELGNYKLEYPVSYQQNIANLILENNYLTDTIISTNDNEFLLYGNNLKKNNRFLINTGQWVNSSVSKNDSTNIVNEDISFKVKTRSYVGIPNWRSLVLKKMLGELLLAILSILTIILLFIYAIHGLIKQKKNIAIKNDFVNNITHELNTPLATLSIAAKALEKKEVQENKQALEATVATINRQRKRLYSLVNQVINNSLGHKEIQLAKTENIDAIWLKQLVGDYNSQEKGIIDLELPIKQSCLLIDTFHMETAVLNILDNAIKYGATQVSIVAVNEGANYSIAIKDNGMGIAKNELNKIFDKFYRIANQNVHNTKGLGLGLYYVKQIIKAHDGSVVVKSELGKGTEVIIKIPV